MKHQCLFYHFVFGQIFRVQCSNVYKIIYESMKIEDCKSYSYTFYGLYGYDQPHKSLKKQSSFYSNCQPLKSSLIDSKFSGGEASSYLTDRQNNLKSSYLNPTSYTPLQRRVPSKDPQSKSPLRQSPITYQYKNPNCGINFTGKSRFEMKGQSITVFLDKVINTRKTGQSGTLQLELVRMSYFYDGISGMRPEQYSSVGVSSLGELEAGWSFSDITRVIQKRPDTQYTYRKCFILLLEEYDDGQYKIVDYVNFD